MDFATQCILAFLQQSRFLISLPLDTYFAEASATLVILANGKIRKDIRFEI